MDFVTLDFETATYNGSSACAIGIGTFSGGQLQQKYYSLIQPPLNEYYGQNIRIHGITPAMTEDAPDLAALWPEICPLLVDKLVLAHCASFDINVLRKTLDYHNLDHPSFTYACTCQLAKKIWPELPSHSLGNMAKFLNIRFKHHNALEDSLVCGAIALAAAETAAISEIPELLRVVKVKQTAFCL